ncbi:MAG: YebC/PmpR family DNA-binding transcriptional regulator [Patescibacteria group bacterium]|nr:YebC/PmpR family DNA-binding transcriptional regulator [Patescibacteria group bacterium]MCL5224114.1 YebC/PmpR family DNA-binding transcriptional regulator [Patescibacteria group bacterium]
MSGHSRWVQIKHKKGVTDKKRGELFSKLLKAIRAASRTEPNPDFNPRLRSAVETAKEAGVPTDNIARAIEGSKNKDLEDLLIEAYGPGGVAILVTATTNNRNRTMAELRKMLNDVGGKVAEPGSVMWAFERSEGGGWTAKFPIVLDADTKSKLNELTTTLDGDEDVLEVVTNAS